MQFRPILFKLLFFFLSFNSYSQSKHLPIDWMHYDSVVQNKVRLFEAEKSLDSIRQVAWRTQQWVIAARSWQLLLQIRDQKTEDTLVMRNSYFIDSLLAIQNIAPDLAFCLHLMQAERIKYYNRMSFRFVNEKYKPVVGGTNYVAMQANQRDSVIRKHSSLARLVAAQLPADEVQSYFWLSTDPLVFLFKPSHFDLAMANEIAWEAGKHYYWNIKDAAKIFEMRESPHDWILSIQNMDSTISLLRLTKLYSDWLFYHRQHPSARYYIETLFRKWWVGILENAVADKSFGEEYKSYLLKQTFSDYAGVRAHAAFQLITRWSNEAQKYLPAAAHGAGSYFSYGSKHQEFDTTARYKADSALIMWERMQPTLDSFLFIRTALLPVIAHIKTPALRIRVAKYHLPDQPILAEIIFRHSRKLRLRVFKKNDDTLLKDGVADSLLIWEDELRLPDMGDVNEHILHWKMRNLPIGKYRIVAIPERTDSLLEPAEVNIHVTRIGVVQNNNDLFLLDRETGYPIEGASVQAYEFVKYDKEPGGQWKPKARTTSNVLGAVNLSDEDITHVKIQSGEDIYWMNVDIEEDEGDDEADTFDREEYDDLIEYYDEHTVAHIFTDRSIYRPGEEVQFKALFLTRNPRTGEMMLLNKKNLGIKRFASIFKKFQQESNNWLFVSDAFNNEVDSIKVVVNEMGSFAGKFRIPLTAATGQWSIVTEYLDEVGGEFSVEEYKRPTYEVSIEKPKEELIPGTPFQFLIKLKSFSGVPMGGVQVKYRLQRECASQTCYLWEEKLGLEELDTVLSDTTALTISNGTLVVPVDDSFWKDWKMEKWHDLRLHYSLEVKVVDASDESIEATEFVSIMARPVRIRFTGNSTMVQSSNHFLSYELTHENAGNLAKPIRIRIKPRPLNDGHGNRYNPLPADTSLYSLDSLRAWFPFYYEKKLVESPDAPWLLDTLLPAGSVRLLLNSSLFANGVYDVHVTAMDSERVLGEYQHMVTILSLTMPSVPVASGLLVHLPYNSGTRGDSLSLYVGRNAGAYYHIVHLTYRNRKSQLRHQYWPFLGKSGLQKIIIPIPADASGRMELNLIGYWKEETVSWETNIYVNEPPGHNPEIIVERYRQMLVPGVKERFELSVKTGNEDVLAELMTTVYDASLDKLESHSWEIPQTNSQRSANANWELETNSNALTGTARIRYNEEGVIDSYGNNGKALWWLNPHDDGYDGNIMGDWQLPYRRRNQYSQQGEMYFYGGGIDVASDYNTFSGMLQGCVPGVSVISAEGLSEVVVVGYSKQRMYTTTAAVTIRGQASLEAFSLPMVIIDGEVYSGNISSIDANSITYGVVLKGADATALYGSRASQGVLILSTKGPIAIQAPIPEAEVVVRKNFNPSAFFFPQLYARDGRYILSFTMPESVTEWKWKMFAHTRDLKFAYAERVLHTRLPLMAQASLPRFLYAGDSVLLKVKVSNLDSLPQSGIAWCRIEDENGNVVNNISILPKAEESFSLEPGTSASFQFPLRLPKDQLTPLSIIMGARSGSFGDAEQHRLPIYNKEILISSNQKITIVGNDTTIHLPVNIRAEKLYGSSVSLKPAQTVEVLDGLRYLANFPADCAEQLVNKIYAELTGWNLMRSDTQINRAYQHLTSVLKSENSDTEFLLGDGTMPWLQLEKSQTVRRTELWRLLDSSRARDRIKGHLIKLKNLQLANGSLSWFPGGNTNQFISRFVLEKLGEMNELGLWKLFDKEQRGSASSIVKSLIAYADEQLVKRDSLTDASEYVGWLSSRSYWLNDYTLSDSLRRNVEWNLEQPNSMLQHIGTGDRALLASSILKLQLSAGLKARAEAIVEDIKQSAIVDSDNGIRWKEWSNSPRSTAFSLEELAAVVRALERNGSDSVWTSGILKWVMSTRQQLGWQSTRFVSAYISLLRQHQSALWQEEPVLNWEQDGLVMEISNDPLGGRSQLFRKASAQEQQIRLIKKGKGISQSLLTWHYFDEMADSADSSKDIKLEQTISVWNEAENKWASIDSTDNLTSGARVLVSLKIYAQIPLEFVQLESYFPACFTPSNARSGYEFSKTFSYYRSVRDERIEFFTDRLPEGEYTIFYETKVEKSGRFYYRPAVLRCMYEPELTAYGKSGVVKSVVSGK